jgi:signal transduction histidine kinase
MLRGWQIRWFILFAAMLVVLSIDTVLGLAMGRGWWTAGEALALILALILGLLSYRDTRRDMRQREVLLKISEELSSRLELGGLLDYIVQAIMQLVPLADKCVIHLLDETGRRLYPRHSSHPDPDQSLGMPSNKGIAGQALQELHTQVVADVRSSPDFLPLRSSAELRALMVAPLHSQGKALGTISLNSSIAGAFSKRDELLVTTLAAQASAAIYQTQLYAAALRGTHQVEAIINNLSDGLVVLDAENRVLRCNPSLGHILGVDVASLSGQKPAPDSENEGLRRLAFVLGDHPLDAHQSYEHQVELSEPIHTILRVNVAPALDQEGNWGQIILLHDQTEELDQIRTKSNFIAAASKELHGPLESIRGYATLLISYDPPERAIVLKWASQIREQSARLMRLAEDLADLCAADCNELEIKAEPVPVCKLLAEVVAETRQALERKGVVTEIQCPTNLPQLPFDRDRVRHVLLNLLENAIHRAVPGGHILLRIEANLEELILTLSDDGQPIPADAQARIFQGPYRSNGSTPQDPVGTGLGLYISRKIIEAHGGHLWINENGERGAKFQFILPLDRVPARRVPPRA